MAHKRERKSNEEKELKTEVETQLPHVNKNKVTGILFCRYSPLPMDWRSMSAGLIVGPGPLLVKYVAKPSDML